MADKTLGQHLTSQLGGRVVAEVTDKLEGCCEMELTKIPPTVTKSRIYESISAFYRQMGYTLSEHSEPSMPIFAKGESTRAGRVSDFREQGGRIFIAFFNPFPISHPDY
jgi:hypothetical protein